MSGSYEIEFQSKVHIELYCDDTNDFIHKTEIGSQAYKTNLWLRG